MDARKIDNFSVEITKTEPIKEIRNVYQRDFIEQQIKDITKQEEGMILKILATIGMAYLGICFAWAFHGSDILEEWLPMSLSLTFWIIILVAIWR